MRLTALRQPPKDISRTKQPRQIKLTSRHLKPILDTQNDSFATLPCVCNPTSANTGKRGRTRQRCAPYGEAAQAPSKTARQNPLPELPTINTDPRNYSTPTNTAAKNLPPRFQLLTDTHRPTKTSHARRPCGRMRHRGEGPGILACSYPLTRTAINNNASQSYFNNPQTQARPYN